jgi:uncharacterized flavoprotein (TIGR03862 family)
MAEKVNIIGAGAAGVFLAVLLSQKGIASTVYDANVAAGRKFLVAGGGGLNITHSEPAESFIHKYTPAAFLKPAFDRYSNLTFMQWLEDLGFSLYTGSSGRVFPSKNDKPIALLNRLIQKAEAGGATFSFQHKLTQVAANGCILETPTGLKEIKGPIVYALGGASWRVTGSTGEWLSLFQSAGCETEDFAASNCQFLVDWPSSFLQAHEGKPLKNTRFSCGTYHTLGEAVITRNGIEGSGVYPLSPAIRHQLLSGKATLLLDLLPLVTSDELVQRLSRGEGPLSKRILSTTSLSRTQLALVKAFTSKEVFQHPTQVAQRIKQLPIIITSTGTIDDAISTTGGLALSEIDETFRLIRFNQAHAIGEMLAYDAPTGGYLLQSCFTMAATVAQQFYAT